MTDNQKQSGPAPDSYREWMDDEARHVLLYAERYRLYWQGEDDDHWLKRLMQEVGELASSLADDHPDPPETELRQIASIAVNWLRLRATRSGRRDMSESERKNGERPVMEPREAWEVVGRVCGWANPCGLAHMALRGDPVPAGWKGYAELLDDAVRLTGPDTDSEYHRSLFYHDALIRFRAGLAMLDPKGGGA